MGWSDPTFGSLWLPKAIVGSLQPRKQGEALLAKCFARVQLRERNEEEETYVDHQQTPTTREARVRVGRACRSRGGEVRHVYRQHPDHVVNSALKMLLWKDKHFMNWRKQQQQDARKEVPITSTQKSQARA
jgi:hypothetical protein